MEVHDLVTPSKIHIFTPHSWEEREIQSWMNQSITKSGIRYPQKILYVPSTSNQYLVAAEFDVGRIQGPFTIQQLDRFYFVFIVSIDRIVFGYVPKKRRLTSWEGSILYCILRQVRGWTMQRHGSITVEQTCPSRRPISTARSSNSSSEGSYIVGEVSCSRPNFLLNNLRDLLMLLEITRKGN